MKKILFVLAVMLVMTLTANAQFYAGGSFQLHADKANYEFAVSPEIYCFVKPYRIHYRLVSHYSSRVYH